MLLCSGVTGIEPAPTIERNAFKRTCYAVFNSDVIDFFEDGMGIKNFYECIIKVKNKRVNILLNGHYPYMAFTSTRESSGGDLSFIEDAELTTIFRPYYQVLTLDQLNEPLEYHQKSKEIIVENENALHQDELKQLVYWQPRKIGDVLFNYWD